MQLPVAAGISLSRCIMPSSAVDHIARFNFDIMQPALFPAKADVPSSIDPDAGGTRLTAGACN